MIHELTMKNWIKHHNRTFQFQEGVNLIRGENEGGKSLILEAIDFAMHGSVALRLPVSMYPNNLSCKLRVTIRGVDYLIERTPKKATLERIEDGVLVLIASGTKPVDAEIRKILGYNRNVFLVSNYSSQDAIQYLSSMKPAERKRTIDNVVGLTAVEQVIAEHKTNLTVLNRELDSVKRREVSQPDQPIIDFLPNFDEVIDQVKATIKNCENIISVQESLIKQHEALDQTKPESRADLPVDGLIEGLTEQEIATREAKIAHLTKQHTEIDVVYARICANKVTKPVEPSREGYIDGVTLEKITAKQAEKTAIEYSLNFFTNKLKELPSLEGKVKFSEEQIAAVKDQWDLYHEWEQVQKHKQKGSVVCNHCNGEVFLAIDYIQKHFSHVPETVAKPEQDHRIMQAYNADIDSILSQADSCKAELAKHQESLADFDQSWYSDIALQHHLVVEEALNQYRLDMQTWQSWAESELEYNQKLVEVTDDLEVAKKDWYSAEQLENHRVSLRNQAENLKNHQLIEQWQKSKSALAIIDIKELESARHHLPLNTDRLIQLETGRQLWEKYHKDRESYDVWNREKEDALCEVDLEKERINALNIFKAKIKTTILPSVNAVASTWMRRMSEGKHQNVELTESMEILVNGEPIEALSISGRALGHLSLRMALGQVLTNSVFPVFMADEVDASMRNNRAQNVLDSLTDMLNGSMKQIIMISHRELDRVDNVIEV